MKPYDGSRTREIIFEVREDEADGGYVACAVGHGIHTQAETLDVLRANVRDAVACHFDDQVPTINHRMEVAELRDRIGI